MRNGFRGAVGVRAIVVVLTLMPILPARQIPADTAPRAADGRPNLNRIWQALNTAQITMDRQEGAAGTLYEYACHEGNYGMEGILGGARTLEKEAAHKTRSR